MSRAAVSLKQALKRVREAPAVNAPVTHAVRGASRMLGMTPEFAIKHLPHSGTTKMSLPGGQVARMWSRGDDWVSNQVFWRGWDGYETETTSLFWRLATASAVTLDIGAHVGFYTLLAARANPTARVFALEPLPVVFERLERNVRLNRLANVVALPHAAGALDGRAEFFHVPGIIPCSSSLSESFMRETPGLRTVEVDVVRVDSLARTYGFDRLDLVKIDTETTEPDVLEGMGPLLADSRPDIICEVLTRADVDALTAILEPLEYAFYLLTEAGPQRRERIVPHERWLNYLFTTGPAPGER